jgi:hypothetical protein
MSKWIVRIACSVIILEIIYSVKNIFQTWMILKDVNSMTTNKKCEKPTQIAWMVTAPTRRRFN